MKQIEYNGITIEYDETCVKKWKWQKAIASGDSARIVKAIENLFCGKDEEVADQIGGDFETMTDLVGQIVDQIGQAKNSRSSLAPV